MMTATQEDTTSMREYLNIAEEHTSTSETEECKTENIINTHEANINKYGDVQTTLVNKKPRTLKPQKQPLCKLNTDIINVLQEEWNIHKTRTILNTLLKECTRTEKKIPQEYFNSLTEAKVPTGTVLVCKNNDQTESMEDR